METAIDQEVARPRAVATAKPDRKQFNFGTVIVFVVLAIMSIVFIVPLLWMVSTSLKDFNEWFGGSWIPTRFAWENYEQAFSYGFWAEWARNTIIISALNVVGHVLSVSLVAYSFARLRWPGRDKMFSILLATMMLPGVVTLIPSFILFSKLPAFGFMGSPTWVNTFLPLVIPAFTGGAFYVFLTRQFMRGIPMELSEAAKIDGASELRIWWSIITPLTKPALAYVAITSFQGAWEDFTGPLLYLQKEHLYTLQLGLRQFEAAAGGFPNWGWLMAASLVVMAPVVIIFIVFQRYFIEGVSMTGMGGR